MAWMRYFSLGAVALLIASISPLAHADYVRDEILVKYKSQAIKQSGISAKSIGAAVIRTTSKTRISRLKLPKTLTIDKAIEKLRTDPNIEYVGPNHILKITVIYPNDEMFNAGYYDWIFDTFIKQWGLFNEDSANRADIHAPEAWSITTGSPNVVIAVLDTGVDYTHPDLASKIWNNTSEIAGNSTDDDHNGYIDDTQGWDFANYDNDPMDDNVDPYGLEMKIFHGTFSSGIAAASTNNYTGMAGVAWGCPIMPIKVMSADGSGLESDVADGIIYAVDMGAKVLNLSLAGTDNVPVLEDAVNYAWTHGAICVCASGNENVSTPMYPAYYANALSVGASNENDQRCTAADWGTGGSNYGDYLDVVAPGKQIISATSMMDDQGYYYMDGTSAAAPIVSGVVALLWSKHPEWSNQKVFLQITRTADDITPVGRDIYTGWGRVNAYRALVESVSVITNIKDAKQATDGSAVSFVGKVLSTSSGEIANRLYVQDDNRSSGILLHFTGTVPANLADGDYVDVIGNVGSISGERAIINPSVNKQSGHANIKPKPIAVNNKTLGGGSFGLQAAVVNEYSYPRIMAAGLSNIGLLVRTYGKVRQVAPDWFYLDDGSGLDDGTGNTGVYVYVGTTIIRPNSNKLVGVTGISSCEILSGSSVPRRVLRPRRQTDISIY